MPDFGLTTPIEVAARTRRIARATELPMLAGMTESGTSDLFTASPRDVGLNLGIWPLATDNEGPPNAH